jgi:hypothetical protein
LPDIARLESYSAAINAVAECVESARFAEYNVLKIASGEARIDAEPARVALEQHQHPPFEHKGRKGCRSKQSGIRALLECFCCGPQKQGGASTIHLGALHWIRGAPWTR